MAFDNECLAPLPDARKRPVHPKEQASFMEPACLRCIHVFGRRSLLAQDAARKANDFPPRVLDGDHDSLTEFVIDPTGIGLAYKPGLKERLFRDSSLFKGLMKGLGIRWSKPQLKGLDNIHTNAAAGKICQSFLSVLSLCQARMEEPGCQLIGPDDFFFLLLPTDFLSRLFRFRNGNSVLIG